MIIKKKLLSLPLIFTIFVILCANSSLRAFSNWESNLNGAIKKADRQRKPIFVHFYTPWCPYCTKMQRETFQNAEVKDIFKSFITVKVNVAADTTSGRKYGVQGVPDNRVYKSDGVTMLMRIPGFMKAPAFALELKKTLKYLTSTKDLSRKYSRTKNSAKKRKLAIKIASQFYKIENYQKAAFYYGKSPLSRRLHRQYAVDHKKFGFSLMALGKYKKAIKQYNNYLKIIGKKNNEELFTTRFFLAYSQLKIGRKREALKNFSFVVKKSKDKNILNEALFFEKRIKSELSIR